MSLRLLVVTSAPPVKRLPELFLRLLDSGVELLFVAAPADLPEPVRSHPGASTVDLPLDRHGALGDAVRLFRSMGDLVRFLGPAFQDARWPRRRALRRVLKLAGHRESKAISKRPVEVELPAEVCETVAGAFRELEQQIPSEPELQAAVDGLGVDGVFLVSRCMLGGNEPDVLKVSRALGLPSILLVWSWDNLSSKATLNEHPDLMIVWNELQVREAVDFHGIPTERVLALGAANFDPFFAELREAERQPAKTPTILYLGSSPKVVQDEPAVFGRWLDAVRASGDERLRTARIAVRPHPASRRWDAWTPPSGVELSVPQAKVEAPTLARLLAGADVVVALNTSAELEAAIAGKPVLTFRAGDAAQGQEGSLHFHYLLEKPDGSGFVVDSATLDEHVERLSRVLRGDHDPEPARRFVSDFIRPHGLDRPVAPQVASAVTEHAAHRRPPVPPWPILAASPSESPRILVLTAAPRVNALLDVFTELIESGAEVLLSGYPAEQLRVPPKLASHLDVVALPLADGRDGHESRQLIRALRAALRFHDESLLDVSSARGRAHRTLLGLVRYPEAEQREPSPFDGVRLPHPVSLRLDDALGRMEDLVRPREQLVQSISELGPSAILVVADHSLDGHETDVIKVARLIGIPSVLVPWAEGETWGAPFVHARPDRILVWNDDQANEVAELHGVPRDHIRVACGPRSDPGRIAPLVASVILGRTTRPAAIAAEPAQMHAQ